MLKTISEPYRYFFLVGIPGALLGASLWIFPIVLYNRWLSGIALHFPVQQHFNIFVSLFFLPIIQGFAFTAIPRFTGTKPVQAYTIWLLILLHCINLVLMLFNSFYLFFVIILWIQITILFTFLFNRIFFPVLPVSNYLYLSVLGAGISLIGVSLELPRQVLGWKVSSIFKHSIIFGFFPLILFSYGTRLLVGITQWDHQANKQEWFQRSETIKNKEILVYSILFLLTFLLEGINGLTKNSTLKYSFTTLRFLLILYWLIRYFHILEYKKFIGALPKMIYMSLWFLVLGFAGYAYGGKQAIHFAHLYFIGGLFIFTFGVMTRVTLSHGGAGVHLEKASKVIYTLIVLGGLSAILRASSQISAKIYLSHLAYSAMVLILFVLVWCIWIVKNTYLRNRRSQ